ncbi:hypothetical protein [Neobacillus jeddahensis]|uniref:hypothetical protein n=1 Tax=Neobacillus jeddahensis TaxID=1461580 RepID=UPI00059017F6|nr:hypothetical protein [Neobacillus jeddahensis]
MADFKQPKKDGIDIKIEVTSANNSSMAQDLTEMKRLGKEMKQAKTGTELQDEDELTPDPLQ